MARHRGQGQRLVGVQSWLVLLRHELRPLTGFPIDAWIPNRRFGAWLPNPDHVSFILLSLLGSCDTGAADD